ncbi:polyhydroxyalkanoate synthesis repressor PhaR, partial [Candidatus Magnetomorum sp. HK-1]
MKTTIIAEIGINHNGSVDIAKRLIESAKKAGADVCKFQTHMPDYQMLRSTKSAEYVKEDIYSLLNSVKLSQKDHVDLKKFCDDMEIEFLSTPFSKEAANLLNDIGVQRFKIGSGELTKYDLLDYVFQLNKPVILSSGMSSFEIVQNSIQYLSKYSNEVSLLHCTSLYPPDANQVNLKMIPKYKKLFP